MGKWENNRKTQRKMDVNPLAKLSHNYGKSPFFMGKPTISMAIFNSYVSLPEGKWDVIGYYLRDCLLFNGSNGEIYIYIMGI